MEILLLVAGARRGNPHSLQHRSGDQRPRDGGVRIHFGESAAFLGGNELAPRDAFGIRATGKSAPMHRLRANANRIEKANDSAGDSGALLENFPEWPDLL